MGIKKLLGFSLVMPMFFGFIFGQEHQAKTGYFFIAILLTGLAMYGLMMLEEIYTAERKKEKDEQQN